MSYDNAMCCAERFWFKCNEAANDGALLVGVPWPVCVEHQLALIEKLWAMQPK